MLVWRENGVRIRELPLSCASNGLMRSRSRCRHREDRSLLTLTISGVRIRRPPSRGLHLALREAAVSLQLVGRVGLCALGEGAGL